MEDNQEKMSTGYKGNYLFSSMLDSGFQAIFDAVASSYLVFFNVGFRFL